MELAIEIIWEALARLPGPLGQTIGVVGGFPLGEWLSRAGLISPPDHGGGGPDGHLAPLLRPPRSGRFHPDPPFP